MVASGISPFFKSREFIAILTQESDVLLNKEINKYNCKISVNFLNARAECCPVGTCDMVFFAHVQTSCFDVNKTFQNVFNTG